jgi:hypothetical protein
VTITLTDVPEAGPTIDAVYVASTAWNPTYLDFIDDQTLNSSNLGYQIPQGGSQADNLAWVNLNEIVFEFSEDVSASIDIDDFSIDAIPGVRADLLPGNIPSILSVTPEGPDGRFVRVRLSEALDASRVTVTAISSRILDADANPLNGEWTNNSSTGSSGDPNPGGDFVFTFDVLPGDLNNDNFVDQTDTALLPSSAPTTSANLLLNVDGSFELNSSDIERVVEREGSNLDI